MTTMCPMPAAVVPDAANVSSRIVTRQPSRASASAHAAPTIPAPTTIASEVALAPTRTISPLCRIETDRQGRIGGSHRR